MQTKSVFHASEEQRFLTTHLVACCEQVVQLAKKGLRDWNTLEHIGTCCQCYSAPQLSEVRTTRWLGCRLLGIPRSAREAIRPAEHTELKRDSNDELLIRLQSLQLAWRIWRLSFALHSIMFLNLQSVPFLLTPASQLKVCTFAILLQHFLHLWPSLNVDTVIHVDRHWSYLILVSVCLGVLPVSPISPLLLLLSSRVHPAALSNEPLETSFSGNEVEVLSCLGSELQYAEFCKWMYTLCTQIYASTYIYIYCIYSCHILTHYIASSLYIMI